MKRSAEPIRRRILLIGPQLLAPWLSYTERALNRLGVSVTCFQENSLLVDRLTHDRGRVRALARWLPGAGEQLEGLRETWLHHRDERLLRLAERCRPDLVLVLWGESLSPGLLEELKSVTRAPLATWWLDNPFRRRVPGRLEAYDHLFIFDAAHVERLRAEGFAQVHSLPCAADETVYRPLALNRSQRNRFGCEVALVCWFYPERGRLIQPLDGLDLKVWGREWNSPPARRMLDGLRPGIIQRDRFLRDSQACLIYNACEVGLNSHSGQTLRAGLNMRAFELLAAGCFELTDAVPEIETLLEPDQEVVLFRSPEEARDKIRYYLAHPNERQRIAAAGRRRVLQQHTYWHRMRELLRVVDGLGPGRGVYAAQPVLSGAQR